MKKLLFIYHHERAQVFILLFLSFLFLASTISFAYAQPSNTELRKSNSPNEQSQQQVKSKDSLKTSKRDLVESKIIELKLRLESSPNDQRLLAALAKLYIKVGDYPNALTYLKASLNLNDQNEDLEKLQNELRKVQKELQEYKINEVGKQQQQFIQ